MKRVVLLALLAGCMDGPEEHFVLDYEPVTLGVGLEHTFMPMRIVCEPHQRFPYACDQARAIVHQVFATGAGELRARGEDTFVVAGRAPGTAVVELHATVHDEAIAGTFDVPVLPIAYSQLGWYTSDTITPPTGAAFRSSTISVWQHHYRVPREKLVTALRSEIMAAELTGDAAWVVDPGATAAALVTDDGTARHAATIATGDALGTTTVRTIVGGAFALDIVDDTAIARLEVDVRSGLDVVVVRPFDAANRPIVGCPQSGPTISDTAGAITVVEIRDTGWTRFCELELAWAHDPTDTTLVVTWGGREARVNL